MDAVHPPDRQAVLDGAWPEPECTQLRSGDDPVLAFSQRRHGVFTWAT